MKCPKCGFVSYPGLAQCKKCGRYLLPAGRKKAGSFLSLFAGSVVPTPEASGPTTSSSSNPSSSGFTPPPASEVAEPQTSPAERQRLGNAGQTISPPAEVSSDAPDRPRASVPPATDVVRPWREELAERVENFRRRRARLRRNADSNLNLGFDFESAGAEKGEAALMSVPAFSDAASALDVTLEAHVNKESDTPILDALPVERTEANSQGSGPDGIETVTFSAHPDSREHQQVGIVLESSSPASHAYARPGAWLLDVPPAPLGRRFLAGLADAVLLLAAAVLFALIFWRAGGRISPKPLNYLVLALVAALFILLYFGVFTALTASTPGLLWTGLEVRSLDGRRPTLGEACSRALGYVVSVAALMLGFIWALVDSEGLTWHDRISGTFLAVAQPDNTLV